MALLLPPDGSQVYLRIKEKTGKNNAMKIFSFRAPSKATDKLRVGSIATTTRKKK